MDLHEVQRPATRVPNYWSPTTLDDVLEAIAVDGHRTRIVAGGTDLLVELDRGAHPGVDTLIDLGRIPDLDLIVVDEPSTVDEPSSTGGQTVRIGALVTHNQVVADERCRTLALPLAQACLEIGSPQLRNRATVAGNVVTASPANDTISALLALGAIVEVASAQRRRTVPLAEFITGFRQTALEPDELVTGISIPIPTLAPGHDRRGIFVKLGLRRAQAISVVHLAATVSLASDGTIADATLALGSVAPTVVLVPGLVELLVGRPLDSEAIAEVAQAAGRTATPIDDLRATAAYRSNTIATMTSRAFAALAADTQASRWPEGQPLLWGAGFDGRFPSASEPMLDTRLGSDDPLTTTVNGSVITAAGAPGITLLDWLREQGYDGVKEGCAEGECGACTVHLDGAAVMSCLVPAGRAADAAVVTVEGLTVEGLTVVGLAVEGQVAGEPAKPSEREPSAVVLHPIQEAFVAAGAVQCGYCTPGFLMSCAKLLEEIPAPTDAQTRRGLVGNLCRCTGYVAIEAAIRGAVSAGDGSSS